MNESKARIVQCLKEFRLGPSTRDLCERCRVEDFDEALAELVVEKRVRQGMEGGWFLMYHPLDR